MAAKIIFDTDIGWMNDDCMAAIFALKSPDIDVLGITPVMGNFDLNYSLACALRLLELLGQEQVPVCRGFDRPLIHERGPYADKVWGKWAKLEPATDIPPGMPRLRPDPRHAAVFLAETVLAHPGEVTIVAVGPLTNVAVALRLYPEISRLVKEIVIMGGAIGRLPRGKGNITPAAEFNFWVDPEAARIVLRSGAPLTLLPLNVCRRSHFSRSLYERIIDPASDYPEVAALYKAYIGPRFDDPEIDRREPVLFYGVFDHACLGYVIRPAIFTCEAMRVDVSVQPGLDYGVSHGYVKGDYVSGEEALPIESGLQAINVAYDMDFEELAELYVSAITRRRRIHSIEGGGSDMDPFMRAAIDEAKKGLAEGGIPIGAVLVLDGEIVGRGHNRRVQKGSAILHAEMDCLENAGRLSAPDYQRATMYTTLSPCDMCSGAILLYKIPNVVIGENRSFQGPEAMLEARGVALTQLDNEECYRLMQGFIRANPDLWNEDIGV